jgi:hypothetical protein
MQTPASQLRQHRRQAGRVGGHASLSLLIALALLLGPCAAYAQVLYGSLTGSVTDATQAAVPGATVEALNLGTGVTKHTTTNERGIYLFSDLQPGVYKITVSAKAFANVVQEGVTIEANRVRRFDATLQVAPLTEVVRVSAPEVALQTDRSDVNMQLQAAQLANLPLTSSAGRNFQALYKLVPGFSMVTEGVSSDGGNPQRTMTGNVNGGSMQNNLTRIDGAANTYMWLPFNTAYVPPTESIESVSIVTNSYDAEQGNSNGAVVNVVTKSGSNEFHGSAFGYHTDNALKALNRFNPGGYRKPKSILNQLGGSVGGPILKGRLFFFADWERTARRMLAQSTKTVINPAGIFDASGNANLSAAIPVGTNCDVTRVAGCIYDPNTGNPDGSGRLAFPGNLIPASRIDPAVKTILGRISKAGFLNSDGVTANNNYVSTGSAKLDRDTVDVKINYVPNDRTMIFGRYSISPTTLYDPPVLGLAMGGATGGGQVGTAPSRIQSAGLGGTYTISPAMVLDVSAGYTRQRLGATYAPDLDLGDYGVKTLQIPGTNGDTYLTGGTPAFLVTNWNAMGNSDTGNPFLFRDNQYVANTNLSWMKGRHGLRFGVEHSRSGMNHYQPQGGAFGTPRGSFNFAGSVTALNGGPNANKANSLAQLLLGVPDRVGKVVQNSNPNSLRWKTWSAYARDSWQVTSKLTVNVGVRWEYYPFATTDHGGVKLFDPGTGNVLICGNGSVPLDCGVDVGHGQFVPRLGIAYRLDSKTVIRAGYGMSADSNNWRFFRNNWPLVSNADVQGTTAYYPAASLTGETLAPYPGLRVGIPAATLPDLSSGVIPLPNNTGVGGATIPFKYRRGYTHSYNLTLQREFTRGLVAEAAYVGSRGIRMLTNENINAAPINGGNPGRRLYPVANKNWGDVNMLAPDANMYYDSLQTKLTWRMQGGSVIGLNYTLSKAINWLDNEEVSGTFGVAGGYLFWPYPDYRGRNKALASFDRTHNLSIYGMYELPFGPKKQWAKSGILSHIAGGWQLNWLLTRTSGNPLTLGGGGAQLNAPGNTQTPDQVGPLRILGGVGPAPVSGASVSCAPTDMSCHYFDPSAFAAVPAGQVRFGTTGRNMVRGPGFFNLDVGAYRSVKLGERLKLHIGAEMFGVTNTPHYGNPGTDVTNTATFGVITSTLNLAGRGSGTGGERGTVFAARVTF